MSTLKKPLRLAHSDRPQDDTVSIVDADGEPIADMVLHDYDVIRAKQIALAVNCQVDLLAACEAARDWALSMAPEYRGNPNLRSEFEQRAALLQIAISQARPEPASRPDVSC